MKTQTTKLKIMAIGPVQTSSTVKNTTRKVVLQVAEVKTDNPFGHTKEPGNAFEAEVYNHNIETFNIGPSLIGEVAHCELEIWHHKSSNGGPIVPRFIINDLSFRI